MSHSLTLARSLLKGARLRPLHTSLALGLRQKGEKPEVETRDITKDRTQAVPVETSLRYLKSEAYKKTYGEDPVWVQYRRNHKGMYPPRKTRKTCIRGGVISTGNPCPICRDEYLVLSEQNVELLRQFICPHTGSILSYAKTGLCQKKHEELLVCIAKARDTGKITYDVPFRRYDYSEYYKDFDGGDARKR